MDKKLHSKFYSLPYLKFTSVAKNISFIAIVLVALFSSNVYGQAPVNDLCDNATSIVCGDSLSGDTNMSTATGAPAATCGTGSGAPGNWYVFTGTGDIIDLSLCSSGYDTKIQVYSGGCSALVCIGGNDDSCGLQSEYSFISQPGEAYYIYVFGFGTSVGSYTLDLTCTPPPPPPANDECITAIDVAVNSSDVCTLTTSGTVAGATPSSVPNPCVGDASNDVWFSFEATATTHVISLLNISGNSVDMVHSMFEGDCSTGITNLNCSDANQSIVNNLTIGNTYYVRVFTFGSNPLSDTTFDICITLPPQPPANDECDMAITVDVNADDSCALQTPGTIAGATPSSNPNSCGGSDDDDVWFSFQATSESHSISLNNVVGSTTDLYHVLYEGTDCNNLSQIYCSDPNQSSANGLTIGSTYFIRVYSFTGTPLQTTTFNVCVSTILPPQGCIDSDPFCSQDGLIFPNETSGIPADPSIDYECLITQPNPSWFHLLIENDGPVNFEIVQNTMFDGNGNPTGDELDVDFIAWGPFTSVEEGCENLNPSTSIDCSYSIFAVENFSIPNAMAGEYYILLITNFDGDAGFISLQQTNFGDPGAGNTDCDIVFDCTVSINEDDNQEICDTEDFEITTTASVEIETYQWYRDGVLLPGETDPTITVNQTGVYRVDADGTDCDMLVSDEITVTFIPCIPDCLEIALQEDFDTGTGRVMAPFTPLIFNGTTQIDANQYTVSNTSATLNTGWYQNLEDHTPDDVNGRMLFLNPSNLASEVEVYRRPVTVTENLEYTFDFWMTTVYDPDTAICPGTGDPTNLTIQVEDMAGNVLSTGTTGDVNNTPDPNWIQYNLAFDSGANTEIQIVLINTIFGGCGNDFAVDDIRVFTDGEPPVIEVPQDLESCDETGNDEATFNLEDVIPEVLNGQDPADFVITFHNSQADADTGDNPIATTTAYVNTENPETIFVRVEKQNLPNCYSTVDFDLIITEEIIITTDLPTEIEFCDNSAPPTLDATPTNPNIDLSTVTYEWTDPNGVVVSTDAVYTPVESGLHTVIVTVPPCSEATFTVDVTIAEAPILDLGPDQEICAEESYEIVPVITGNITNITYLWSTGETTPTITVDQTGTYELTITTGTCVVTDSVVVTILAPLEVSIGDDFETCFSDTTELTVTSSDFDIADATIQWFLNGVEIMGETMPSLPISEVGTYSVIVTFENCTSTDDIVVTQREDVAVTIVEQDFKTCPEETNTLTAITDDEDVTYQWFKNGDLITGETNAILEFALTPDDSGLQTFSVEISVGDCTAEDDITIELYDVDNCTISQGISPNNDGFNDSLDLEFLNDRTGIVKLQIFNRLGALVYEKTNYINEWQGQTTDSEELPTGTYYYVLDLQGEDPVFGPQASGWIYLNREAN